MPHVFVESNWLFSYAAPAHHQIPAAAELLDRARKGDFTIHMPSVCIGEARQAILAKCKPRHEADALRRFLKFGVDSGIVAKVDDEITRRVLQQYENRIERDLREIDEKFRGLAELPYFRMFSFDDEMLNLATSLAFAGIAAKPFDHAILAGVLARAKRLSAAGDNDISFYETDSDLQPWDRNGNEKPLLAAAYKEAGIRVYGDFTLS